MFGDLLSEEGDPRGELIQLELAGDTAGQKRVMRAHAKTWLQKAKVREVQWRFGFLAAIEFKDELDTLTGLLQSDTAQFLRTLRLLKTTTNARSISAMLKAIARSPAMQSTLWELNLTKTSLTEIPAELLKLSALRNLDISYNAVDVLPKAIGGLEHLESLNLYGNQLNSLPEAVCELPKLQELNLGKNHLSALPKNIGKLGSLRNLNLYSNKLKELPDSIVQLQNLELLSLYKNGWRGFPQKVGQLTKLRSLDIGKTMIRTFPESILKLGAMEELSFYRTGLGDLPPAIEQLGKLKKLSIFSCDLQQVPDEVGNLSGLETLWLYANRLRTLPTTLTKARLPNLKSLEASHNPWDDRDGLLLRLQNDLPGVKVEI